MFVSPHYYPYDDNCQLGGQLEQMMHEIDTSDRKRPLAAEGLEGSGADWHETLKPSIADGDTVVTNPQSVRPENNDLALQPRNRDMSTVLLAGMSANLCVESHMRALDRGRHPRPRRSEPHRTRGLPGDPAFQDGVTTRSSARHAARALFASRTASCPSACTCSARG